MMSSVVHVYPVGDRLRLEGYTSSIDWSYGVRSTKFTGTFSELWEMLRTKFPGRSLSVHYQEKGRHVEDTKMPKQKRRRKKPSEANGK